MDVNVTTRNKIIKEQMFKDKEPRKAQSVVDWEKEEQLKKSMVETKWLSTSMEGWNTTWAGMPNTIHVEA
jgi:hypothetical protein